MSRRAVESASAQSFGAMLLTRSKDFRSPMHRIDPVVDRIGAGDALVAGIIHSLRRNADDLQSAVDFGAAAGAIQQALRGDASTASEQEISAILGGEATGHLQR